MAAVDLLKQHHSGKLVRERELAERQAMIDVFKLDVESERPADHEGEVAATAAALLEKVGERDRIELLTATVQQGDERPIGQPPWHVLVEANLDQLETRVSGEQLLVVLHIIGERWAQPAHGNDDDPHD